MPKSNGFPSEVHELQVLMQDDPLGCEKNYQNVFSSHPILMCIFVEVLKLQWKYMQIIYKYITIQSRIFLLTQLCNFSVESTDIKNDLDLKKNPNIITYCLPCDKKKYF